MKRKRKVDGDPADGSEEAAGGFSPCTDSEDGLAWSVDADVEEVVLPGVDDPAALEQFALWKERRFTDVWLQVRLVVLPVAQPPLTHHRTGWTRGRAGGTPHPGHAHAARVSVALHP